MRSLRRWLVPTFFFLLTGLAAAAPTDVGRGTSQEATLFPEGPLFFAPLASPREPRTHVTWLRLNLPQERINLTSVGFGDSFSLTRWSGGGAGDFWQFGFSGSVLALFNMDASSTDLINADYVIGFPLSYRNGAWSGRMRTYHLSSHLGDEFILIPQPVDLQRTRINLSYEAVELLGGWEADGWRLIAGPTYIFRSFTPLDRISFQAGIDYLHPRPICKPTLHLFASLHCESWEETDWNRDLSVKAGINIRNPTSQKRAMQIFAEYFQGNLPFGQFYNLRADYYGAGIIASF